MACQLCPYYNHDEEQCTHPSGQGYNLYPHPDDECYLGFDLEDVREKMKEMNDE